MNKEYNTYVIKCYDEFQYKTAIDIILKYMEKRVVWVDGDGLETYSPYDRDLKPYEMCYLYLNKDRLDLQLSTKLHDENKIKENIIEDYEELEILIKEITRIKTRFENLKCEDFGKSCRGCPFNYNGNILNCPIKLTNATFLEEEERIKIEFMKARERYEKGEN